ncbi:MAG: ferredoxin [Lentisphaerae bacterium]|nr:MAG: ferredoxin [Lentisphaerota bacterium]
MHVKVDPDLCGACGVCEQMCPDVFALDGGLSCAEVLLDPIPEELEEDVRDAADECPAGAILITDE